MSSTSLSILGVKEIEKIVVRTRSRVRLYRVVAGAGWALTAALGWLLLGAGVDLLAPLPMSGRCIVWAVFWTLVAGLAALAVFWPAVRPLPLSDIAFRIERALPGMHNRLVTVLDLKNRTEAHREDSAGFVDRLISQTFQRLSSFRVEQVASLRPVRNGLASAALVVGIGAAMLFVFHERMPTALARMLRPTAPIAPVSSVVFHAEPGDAEVLQGDPASIRVAFDRGHADDMMLRVRAGDGAWTTYPLQPDDDGRLAFTISAVDASITYQIVGGGTWTREHQLTMVRRPIIQTVDATVRLPAYMGLPEPRAVPNEATQISAPVGSTVELSADVSGDAVRGQISLLKSNTKSVDAVNAQELVWFDDDAPRDAELTGAWQWTTAQVHSGTRAHTFNWRRETYGFNTRLSPLAMDPASDFFVYAWIDPEEPPTRLVVTIIRDKQPIAMAWGAEPAPAAPGAPPAPAPGAKPVVPAVKPLFTAPLPEPGKWVRLEVPFAADAALRAAMGGSPTAPAMVSGITFETDRGRVVLDRVGALRRVKSSNKSTTYETLGTLPMTRDEKSGRWTGKVPVEADAMYSIEFFSARNDASPPIKPMPVVATVDQPPAVIVEKPGKSITIPEAQPVPLMVTALDDYGVADIGIQVGATPDKLNEPRWLAHFDQPAQSRPYLGSIDPRMMAIAPGSAAHYRIVVRDRKGQIGQSEVFRLGLAAPGQGQAAGTEKGISPLTPLLDGISKLLSVQGKIAANALDLLGNLPKGVTRKIEDGKTVKLLNPDGTEVTAEQLKEWLDKRWAEMTPQEREAMQKLDAQAAQQRIEALMLAQKIDAAALEAQNSAMTLPQEAQALHAMADQVRDLAAKQPEPGEAGAKPDPDVLARLQELETLTPEQKKEMADLERQLQDLQKARAAMGEKPEDAQQQMQALLSDMQANWAMKQMSQLDDSLESERAKLESLQQQVAKLQEETRTAPGEKLDKISDEQQALDAKALETLKEAQDLLRERMAGKQEEKDPMPLEPWVAPGQRNTADPAEADTPEKDKPKKDEKNLTEKEKAAAAAAAAAKKAEEEAKKNWWDKPIDQPLMGSTLEDDARRKADNRPVEADPKKAEANANDPKSNDQKDAEPKNNESKNTGNHPNTSTNASSHQNASTSSATPRQALTNHQSQMQQGIGKNVQAMQQAQQDLNKMASQAQNLMDQLRSGKADAKSVAQQLQQMMNSQGMKWASAASARSASSAQSAAMSAAAAKAGSKSGGSKASSAKAGGAKPSGGQSDAIRGTPPPITQM
ncbi:MAG: hypothetical protein NTW19_00250, partial [Planctomycetota bacterium]|nr:hypothetical protein [Planctomycetota bacterium]